MTYEGQPQLTRYNMRLINVHTQFNAKWWLNDLVVKLVDNGAVKKTLNTVIMHAIKHLEVYWTGEKGRCRFERYMPFISHMYTYVINAKFVSNIDLFWNKHYIDGFTYIIVTMLSVVEPVISPLNPPTHTHHTHSHLVICKNNGFCGVRRYSYIRAQTTGTPELRHL